MKIVSIVGARPEFVQAASLSRRLRVRHEEILVHTGQHYDYLMSQAFFDELELPAPDFNLGVGSGTHARQTAEILTRLDDVLRTVEPDLVIVRGDTNSTLAAALAASKLHIPTAHIEAGERSYDRRMPEEVNRLVADCLAEMHFCVSQAATARLADEGIQGQVYWVGDVMLDTLIENLPSARSRSRVLERLGLAPRSYALVTVHRAANTDDLTRLGGIIKALNEATETVIFPAHPRTREALKRAGAELLAHVQLIDPLSYFDMLVAEEGARLIATDSGGVQREAYFLRIPCLTLRDETEWVETVETGWNRLVGANPEKILEAWRDFTPPAEHPEIFGDGTAALRIEKIVSGTRPHFGGRRQAATSGNAHLASGARAVSAWQ